MSFMIKKRILCRKIIASEFVTFIVAGGEERAQGVTEAG
jgi:hypothetical protein